MSINVVLERTVNLSHSWLAGPILFLFKKGELLPVCLQDSAYKVPVGYPDCLPLLTPAASGDLDSPHEKSSQVCYFKISSYAILFSASVESVA